MNKSEKRIRAAFFKMRKNKNLEEIKITELCELADVHKSTFYTYYHDIYELSDILQNEIIEKIIQSFQNPRNIIDNPEEFTVNVLTSCLPDVDAIKVLFSGTQSNKIPIKLNESIKNLFYQFKPDHKLDIHYELMLSYKVFGAYYSYQANPNFDSHERIKIIGRLSGSFK